MLPVNWTFPVNRAHPLNRGLVSWLLNTPYGRGGTTWRDLAGVNDGTLTGMDPATDWVPAGDRRSGWGALDFDGVNDHISLPKSQDIITSVNGAISWWMNPRLAYNDSTVHIFWSHLSATSLPELSSQKFSDDNMYIGFNASGEDDRVVVAASATNYPQGIWSHYVLTWVDGGTSFLFHNGKEIGNNGGGTMRQAPTDSNMYISRMDVDVGRWFDGRQDDYRFYSRSLSAAEVRELYDLSRTGYGDLLNRRRRVFAVPAVAPGGLSIPVAMHHYTKNIGAF